MAEVCQVASEETTRGFWTNKAKEEMFGHTAQHHVWQKQIPHVNCQACWYWTGDDLGLFCSLETGRLAFIELTMKSVTFEAICPRAKGWLVYNSMGEKEKNQGVTVAQSKCRP